MNIRWLTPCLTLIIFAAFSPGNLLAQQVVSSRVSPELRRYLQDQSHEIDDTKSELQAIRASVAEVRLRDGRRQVFVYLTGGRAWCGSGGCTLLILEPHGSTFREIGAVGIMFPPVRLLSTSSNGRPDISVSVKGEPNEKEIPTHEVQLRFNGMSYPNNPTVSPAQPIDGKIHGQQIFSFGEKETRIYP